MSALQTILVFGKNGQVAQALARLALPVGLELQFAGQDKFDLLTNNPGDLIGEVRPAGVINAAAYTAVDKAQTEPEAAFRLNMDAPAAMAKACAGANIPFVHISTDYVFDGSKVEPYIETDPRSPISIYGVSKAAGEDAVGAAKGCWTILRTAWVLSPFAANFIKTMVGLADRDEVSVVADQYGRPTLAADIATIALNAVVRSWQGDSCLQGLFHLAGADDAVWADLADRVFDDIVRRSGRRPLLKRITTAEYPTPARRPANSRLDSVKLQQAVCWSPRPWRETVDICLNALQLA